MQQIQSRIDWIYVASQLQQNTFNWRIEASVVPTNHWLVQVKYAPNDAPYTGKGRWSWPLMLIEDQNTTEKIIRQGIQL
jgi:hypothetical protein